MGIITDFLIDKAKDAAVSKAKDITVDKVKDAAIDKAKDMVIEKAEDIYIWAKKIKQKELDVLAIYYDFSFLLSGYL